MTTEQLNTTALFVSFDDAKSQFVKLFSAFDENEINTIPGKDSWTAAQVAAHVAKTNTSVAELLLISTKTADRKPDERVNEIKNIFLNFTVKFQASPAILPTYTVYPKEALVQELQTSFEYLKESGKTTNLSEAIQHHALGETTKFEMIYLAVYHTLRHINQLTNIYRFLQNQSVIH